jgi:adenylate cyclase
MEPLPRLSFDAALGQQIIALHRWAVDEGLRGVAADRLFEGLCNRLVAAGVPLARAFAGGRTLHPQWAGYAYFWYRDSGAVAPEQRERGEAYEQEIADSAFAFLIEQAPAAAA